MELLQLELKQNNKLVHQYIYGENETFFHYFYKNKEHITERYNEIMERTFPRKELVVHIREYMKKFSFTEEINRSLSKLEEENSVVVLGGQQAGLLTGPLYSVHKMISIIKLAGELERYLERPVVPVFWVAGEDHDIHEVNHVYKMHNGKLVKSFTGEKYQSEKQMVSTVELDRNLISAWYKDIIASFGETDYTKHILQFIQEQLEENKTYTEFFVGIANELFKDYGLLFIDSANPDLRKIESSYFQTLIEYSDQITVNVLKQQKKLAAEGFDQTIDTKKNSLQLFYHDGHERILLYYDDDDKDTIRAENYTFTKSGLVRLVREHPEKLSNNVITRPIMQEFLFPTIAFIAGPGEISYWAELKKAFELLGLKIPPIFPRLNITVLERQIERDMGELGLSLEDVLMSGTEEAKQSALEKLKAKEIEEAVNFARQRILAEYESVASKVIHFDKGLERIVRKNSEFVVNQLEYLRNKVEQSIMRKNETLLKKFDRIGTALHPFGNYQERCWNVFYFLNKYGMDFIKRMMELPFECNGKHFVVKV